MKHLKLLVCALALASLALFTGCGGDDDGNGGHNNNPSPIGDNAPGSLVGKNITADNGDTVTLTDGSNYSASFGGIGESGTYVYAPNGDTATLTLTPTEGAGSTITLSFNDDSASGNYTLQETGQSGTFTVQ
jgi:hypothetical protein